MRIVVGGESFECSGSQGSVTDEALKQLRQAGNAGFDKRRRASRRSSIAAATSAAFRWSDFAASWSPKINARAWASACTEGKGLFTSLA